MFRRRHAVAVLTRGLGGEVGETDRIGSGIEGTVPGFSSFPLSITLMPYSPIQVMRESPEWSKLQCVMATRKPSARVSRILVADDDPRTRKLFVKKLRSAGYAVSEARSGTEALSLLRGMHYRLLVLDLDMPDSDGFEVLKTVRSDFPHLLVLVVSGYMHGVLLKAAECFGARLTLERTTATRLLVPMARKLLGDIN
jgi:CheY-like chemotaxis protein